MYPNDTICAPCSFDQPPAVMIRISPALTSRSRITAAFVAFDSALSRFGWMTTVSAIAPPLYTGIGRRRAGLRLVESPERGRAGTGRQAGFRSRCSQERVGSTPSARIRAASPSEVAVRDQAGLECALGQPQALLVLRCVLDLELVEQC